MYNTKQHQNDPRVPWYIIKPISEFHNKIQLTCCHRENTLKKYAHAFMQFSGKLLSILNIHHPSC